MKYKKITISNYVIELYCIVAKTYIKIIKNNYNVTHTFKNKKELNKFLRKNAEHFNDLLSQEQTIINFFEGGGEWKYQMKLLKL